MLQVSELGLYSPVGLEHLKQSSSLQQAVLQQQYQNHVYIEDTEDGLQEEVLHVGDCVVWSQGSRVKRIFRFQHEGERVDQAILTWFPANNPPARLSQTKVQDNEDSTGGQENAAVVTGRDRALVVLLGRQAQIYLSHGSSHTTVLPFDVERIFAAPRGILIQRRILSVSAFPPTPVLPQAPPNSFWTSQPRPSSSFGSIPAFSRLTPRSRGVGVKNISLSDFVIEQHVAPMDELPPLFALTDPLADIGLVDVSVACENESLRGSRSSAHGESTRLSEAEQLLYISSKNEYSSHPTEQSQELFIALTVNKIKRLYTIWHASYPESRPKKTAQRPRKSGVGTTTGTRRRSSFAPRLSTGTVTPVPRRRPKRESAITNKDETVSSGGGLAEALEALDGANEQGNLASADQPFDIVGKKLGNDRRTSSMMARAELSSQDQNTFTEMARNPSGTHTSFRNSFKASQSSHGAPDQTSFGRSRLSGRVSLLDGVGHFSETDDLTTIADSIGDDIDLLDLDGKEQLGSAFDGLSKDMTLSRLVSVPFAVDKVLVGSGSTLPAPEGPVKVFVGAQTRPHLKSSDEDVTFALNVHIVETHMLAQIWCSIKKRPASRHSLNQHSTASSSAVLLNILPNVYDAARLPDGVATRTVSLIKAPGDVDLFQVAVHGLKSLRSESQNTSVLLRSQASFPSSVQLENVLSSGRLVISTETRASSIYRANVKPRDKRVCLVLDAMNQVLGSQKFGFDIHDIWLVLRNETDDNPRPGAFSDWQVLIIVLTILMIDPSDEFIKIRSKQEHLGVVAKNPDSNNPLSVDQIRNAPPWTFIQAEINQKMTCRSRDLLSNCFSFANSLLSRNRTREIMPWLGFNQTRRSRRDLALSIMGGLHILKEERGLSTLSQVEAGHEPRIDQIMEELAFMLQWHEWQKQSTITTADQPVQQPYYRPMTLLSWLHLGHINKTSSARLLFDRSSSSTNPTINLEKKLLLNVQDAIQPFMPRLVAMCNYSIQSIKTSNPFERAVIMKDCGITTSILETLPAALSRILQFQLDQVQSSPNTSWPPSMLQFISRPDLTVLREESSLVVMAARSNNSETYQQIDTVIEDMLQITDGQTRPTNIRKGVASETKRTLALIYRQDRRWAEASKLLDPLRVAVATILPQAGCSETEFLEAQKSLAQLVYKRTMAIPSGSAILNFNSYRPLVTEKIEIYPFNTTCNMQPSNNTVNADKSNFTEEKVSWAFFHAGVHAGLRIQADAPHIDTSWLVLNRPSELGNRHAGLLFALGLNGHLKTMAKWLAFKYLTPKHNMTSIGLLLGLSASHMGTMDSLVTRLLSVHVTRLLPPGAAELNLSPLTQTAGVLGVGLLYYNSQHRRMSEVMLSELECIGEDGSSDSPGALRDEGYRLAAGISLGFINLGKGRDTRILRDMKIFERLLTVAKGTRNIELIHVLDQATAGASVAIMLIFMKSHNRRLAEEIGIPMNIQQFDYIRPDILLLRTVASNLIMWDEIEPNLVWINSKLPGEYRGSDAKDSLRRALDQRPLQSSRLPIYNILAGLCWSIALRHAGLVQGSQQSLVILQDFFDMISKVLDAVHPATLTYDELLTRDALLRFQHLLALSMATVVAGSGNLSVLRRLRYLHGTIQVDQTFGLHQAAHMAIGLLFMGQGRYTLGTSDLAIASLICACYPLFPKDVLDNRAHLQALRHLWIFAAEPRCLLLIDMDTRQPVVAPISVYMRDGTQVEMEAPCLVPPLDVVKQVQICSPKHWPVSLDFETNISHLGAFKKHHTVVLRRKDELSMNPTMFQAQMWLGKRAAEQKLTWRDGTGNSRMFGDAALDWVFATDALRSAGLSRAHAHLGLLGSSRADALDTGSQDREALVRTLSDTRTTALDDALVLYGDAKSATDASHLLWLKLLLDAASSPSDVAKTRLGAAAATLTSSASLLRPEWLEALQRAIAERIARESASLLLTGPEQVSIANDNKDNSDADEMDIS